MEKPLLTISILISNSPDNVKRCLDSIVPIMEQIPTELILTDTGCEPELRTMIETYTDHVIDFVWCLDFSAARNVGLAQAKGEWFLYIDDDEWFEDVKPLVDFLQSSEQKNYNVVCYTQKNYMDFSYLTCSEQIVDRLLRWNEGLHFEHRVHEAYCGIEVGQKKLLPSIAGHDGYVVTSDEQVQAKYERNNRLLELECKEYPEDMRLWYQWAIAQYDVKDWDKAIACCKEATEKESDSAYWDALHNVMLFCLLKQENWQEATRVGEEFLEKELFPNERFGVLQHLIKAYWKLGEYAKVISCGEKGIAIWLDRKSHPEDYDGQQIFRQEFFEDGEIAAMFLMILEAAIRTEDERMIRILSREDLTQEMRLLFCDSGVCSVTAKNMRSCCDTDRKRWLLSKISKEAGTFLTGQSVTTPEFVRPVETDFSCAPYQERKTLQFSEHFFEGEEREGFYVEPMMKHAWAAEIALLHRIGQICDANGLSYFMDWGSLLGTVRHHGFIPWDDDIDICMKRNDVWKLGRIIEEQYPEITFMDPYSNKVHGMRAIRVTIGAEMLLDRQGYKDNYGFPLPAGMDIFVLDQLPDEQEDRQELKRAMELTNIAYRLWEELEEMDLADRGYFSKRRSYRNVIEEIEGFCHMRFSEDLPKGQELLVFIEEIQSMYRNEKTEELTQMNSYCVWDYRVPAEVYDEVVYLPFENLMVPVPADYDMILKKKYGEDYMIPRNSAAGHEYPFYNVLFRTAFANCSAEDQPIMIDRMKRNACDYYRNFLARRKEPMLPLLDDSEEGRIRGAEAEVVLEIRRICQQEGISLYGIGETADKAGRNGAYEIGDEILLGMDRRDYMRFLRILPEVLDPWFDYRDPYHTKDHEDVMTYILTDGYGVDQEEYEKRFCGCPYTVAVGILPMEAAGMDTSRKELFQTICQLAEQMPTDPPYEPEILAIVDEFAKGLSVTINTEKNLRNEWMKCADQVIGSCYYENSTDYTVYGIDAGYSRRQLENAVCVSFGGTEVMVPAKM